MSERGSTFISSRRLHTVYNSPDLGATSPCTGITAQDKSNCKISITNVRSWAFLSTYSVHQVRLIIREMSGFIGSFVNVVVLRQKLLH